MIRLRLLRSDRLQLFTINLFTFLFLAIGTQIATSTHDVCPSSCKGARITSVDAKSYTSLMTSLGIQGCDIDSRDACHPSFCADLAMECSCSNCSIRLASIKIKPALLSPSRSTSRFINGPLEFENLERFEIIESTLAGSVPTIYSSGLKSLRITGNKLLNGSLDSLEFANSLEELDLSNNDLRGNIPNLGFERPFLKRVNMSGNNFNDINNMIFASNIETIDLSGNKLAGPFPSHCVDALDGNQAQGRRRRLRKGNQRLLETKQCLIGGQRVPTASPFVQITHQPTVSTCASIPVYPNTAVTPLRTSTGFSSKIVQITSDSTDGIVFNMRYSLNQPYFESTTTSVSSMEDEPSSNFPSRVQIGLVSSFTNDSKPVLIFDVMAHSDHIVSARIFARFNGTVGILSQGSAKSQAHHHNTSKDEVVSVFCSWKRNLAVDIKCGLALEAYIVEFTMVDPKFEQAILSVVGFTPGTDVIDLNGMASLNVQSSAVPTSFSVVPLDFSLEANAWTPLRRHLRTSSETNPRLFAMDGPRRLLEQDQNDDHLQVQCIGYSPFLKINVTCDLKDYPYLFNFVDGDGKLTTGLQGCASINEFPPAQSKDYQNQGLTWCPTKLGIDMTYFKRDRLGNANTNWAVCLECISLQQQSDGLPQVVTPSTTQIPTVETAQPSPAPTILPEPFNFEYCESAFNLFAPYRCNPFNCMNGSVRCVDDLFAGDGCGEQNQLDRCDKLGVSLVACPLDDYYTCNNGKCVDALLGAEGCEDHGGVRFSPLYCMVESPSPTIQPSFLSTATDSPHHFVETSSPSSRSPTMIGLDNNTSAASISPLIPAVATVGVLIVCLGLVFVCWRRGSKARKWSKLVAAAPTSRIRRFSTNPLAFSSTGKLDRESALLKKTSRAVAEIEPQEAPPATAPCPLEPLQEDELANMLADTLVIQPGPPTQKRSSSLGGTASKHQLKSFASTSTMATAKLSTPTLSNRELFPQGEDINTPVGSSSLPTFSPFLRHQFDTEPALPSTPLDMDLVGSFGLEINFEDIELGGLLGAGGNGRIFKATYNGTPVAVKELFSVMRGSSTEFSREFEALKLLRHPHIIQLFGTCLAPSVDAKGISRHFIVTELAHESLADRLARVDDPIDQATAERYATEIASAGAFIHAHNMIHFDIKPQNVLLDMTGTVKICDLGIAKFVQMSAQGENHVTLTSAQGTPAYMSPELLAGDDASKISKKVDVYAFGVLTWEIAHRTPPYPASWSLLTLFRKVDSGYRPVIDEDKLPYNTPLRQVVEQCWAGEPEDRPNFKDVIGLLTKKKTLLPSPIREAMRSSPRRQSPYHPLFGVSPEPGSRVTIRTGPVEEEYDGDEEEMMMQNGEMDRPQSWVSTGSPRKSELFRQRSGTVVGVNEDGSLAVQMDPEVDLNNHDNNGNDDANSINAKASITTEGEHEDMKQQPIVNVSTADIIQVMEPLEMGSGDDGQGFVRVDRTIRGLALSHARRKVQEYKRAMQQQQQEKSENRRMIKRQLSMSSAKIGGDDMKLVVLKQEDDDAFEERRPNEALRLHLDAANEDDNQDGAQLGMGLGLKLDLDDDALKTDEDNKSVDLENGLLITEGVPLDANGGLTRHANRKVFKKDLDVSFDTTMVSFMNDDDDDEDDALVNFPSIAQESVVVLSELGSGACGMVYKAIHVSTLQLIAIKRVNVADKLKRHQVVRETRIMLANNLHTTNVKSPPRLISSVSAKDLRGSFKDRKGLTKQHSSFSKRLLEYPSARFGSSRLSSKQNPLRRPGLGKRFASANSPALVISPATKSDRKLLASTSRGDLLEVSSSKQKKGTLSILSTEDVARGITQVKASSFACEKIVKLYDAALFAREIFADSFRVAADGSEKDFALVMEYLDGGSLEDHMKHSGPCESEATIAKVAVDCLEALHFLQINKIIHRDIKPANILLSRKGTAKLTDFGVVKELDDDSMNLGKTFVGTITYMSPERLRGHPYSFVSDVWSLGLTLLAFALGKYPVDREKSRNIFALLEFFEKDDVLRGLENRFSPELLAFFRASLHPTASERPDAKTLLSHPFIVNYMNDVNSVLHTHPRGESMHLSFEDKTLDLQLIARKVVEKMMLDWMNQQSTSEFPKEGVEFTFAEESFIRLAHQLSVTVDDVREAFTEQVDQLKDVLN